MRTLSSIIGVAIVLVAATCPVRAQDTPPSEQLSGAVELRHGANQSSAASQRKIDSLGDQTDALFDEYRSVLKQIEALKVYNAEMRKLIEAQEREAEDLRRQIEQVGVVSRALTPLMLEMLDSLEAFVELDLPFLPEERSRRVEGLGEMMARSDVTVAEKYRRILEAYQVENEYGRTIEAYQGSVEIDGESRTVDFLRIGRLVLLYQTLDGEDTGMWDATAGNWVELGGRYRQPVRQGLRMARKQAAPDLIAVPVPVAETLE